MKEYRHLNHSRNHAIRIISFYDATFKMIEELINSYTVNSQHGQFSQKSAFEFFTKQTNLRPTIKVEKSYCLDLIAFEINSVFNNSITELNMLNQLIIKIPNLEKVLRAEIRKKKIQHFELTKVLNESELSLSAEVRRAFDLMEAKFANQTERIKLTFGLN